MTTLTPEADRVANHTPDVSTVMEHFTRNTEPENTKPGETKSFTRFYPSLPLYRIEPSPLNPRKHFDEDALAELAESISAHGVQQPIVVRDMNPNALTAGEHTYQIVMGERRFRAARLAGCIHIPALIRTDLTDQAHAELALEENIRRRDLTPIEEARGYQQCMALGTAQKDIGEKVGASQSRISNLIRLLDLPEDVQQLVGEGKLSTGHGIQLARYKDFPALCRHLAKMSVDIGWSVRTLEAGLTQQTTLNACQAGLIERVGGSYTAFDWKKTCAGSNCPFHAFRGMPDRPEGGYCLKPEHYQELQKAAVKEQETKAAQDAARLREQAIAQAKAAQEKAAAATTKNERASAEMVQKQAEATAQTLATGFPKLEYGKIVELRGNCPAECAAGTCPCHIQAQESYTKRLVPACADPKRKARLEAQETKEKNKPRREHFDSLRASVEVFPWARIVPLASDPEARRAMALLAWHFLRNAKSQAKKEVAGRLPETELYAPIRALLLRQGYEVPDLEAYAVLSSLATGSLLEITTEVFLRHELIERYDYGGNTAEKTVWFLQPSEPPKSKQPEPAEPPENDDKNREGLSSRLHSCADCNAADGGAFYVDANGDETYKEDIGGNWVCFACQEIRQALAQTNMLTCAGCGDTFPDDAFSELNWAAKRSEEVRMSSGHLLLPDGTAFCDQCGPQAQGGFLVGERVTATLGETTDIGIIKDIKPRAGHIMARIVFNHLPEQLVRVDRLSRRSPEVASEEMETVSEELGSGEGATPYTPDTAAPLCVSCGVARTDRSGVYCADCNPAQSASGGD